MKPLCTGAIQDCWLVKTLGVSIKSKRIPSGISWATDPAKNPFHLNNSMSFLFINLKLWWSCKNFFPLITFAANGLRLNNVKSSGLEVRCCLLTLQPVMKCISSLMWKGLGRLNISLSFALECSGNFGCSIFLFFTAGRWEKESWSCRSTGGIGGARRQQFLAALRNSSTAPDLYSTWDRVRYIFYRVVSLPKGLKCLVCVILAMEMIPFSPSKEHCQFSDQRQRLVLSLGRVLQFTVKIWLIAS